MIVGPDDGLGSQGGGDERELHDRGGAVRRHAGAGRVRPRLGGEWFFDHYLRRTPKFLW